MTKTVERPGAITFRGRAVTLLGPEVTIGAPAPDFTVIANDMSPVTLASTAGTTRVIASAPSLDTPVCDQQTRRFNEEAARIGGVTVLTISVDLPFAQARWCGAAGIESARTASDHRDLSFGLAYGVVVKEMRMLTRAVFVVDSADRVVYAEYAPEATQHLDYALAVKAAATAR